MKMLNAVLELVVTIGLVNTDVPFINRATLLPYTKMALLWMRILRVALAL